MIITNYISLFLRKISSTPRFRSYQNVQVLNNENLDPSLIYIVVSNRNKKWAQFLCPCGCGEAILLNLSTSKSPSWKVYTNLFGNVTISPSVWRTEGCKSHFFVKNGKVDWCPQSSRLDARFKY